MEDPDGTTLDANRGDFLEIAAVVGSGLGSFVGDDGG